MRRSIAAASFVILAQLAVAGCDDPTKGKTAATVGSVIPADSASTKVVGAVVSAVIAPSASAAAANVTKYLVAADVSSVGFVGSKITGKHEGKFGKVSGTIELTDGKPESAKVTIEIDVASVKTDQEKLDTHLKSKDFFDVEHFPKATFVSTSIAPSTAAGATHLVSGNLELHGVKRAIGFPATITVSGDTATATAEFTINRKDFGVVYPGKPDDLIKDNVLLKISIKGLKAS